MLFYLTKTLIAAVIIVAVTEVSKTSTLLGALIKSLPLISIISLIWLYLETKDLDRVAGLSRSTFWLVLPTLPMFLLLPYLLSLRLSFAWSMLLCVAFTALCYVFSLWIYRVLGISL